MSRLNLTTCPTCGSKNIQAVRKAVSGSRQGKSYSAPDVEFYECPDCGERVYDSQAIRKIEKHSIVPPKQRNVRKIA
jgi:YgiT-type zinc finger domain-containing protein